MGKQFGPGKGLVVGAVLMVALLGLCFRAGAFGLFDTLALAALVRGLVVHYRAHEEARIIARGEAAIAAADRS